MTTPLSAADPTRQRLFVYNGGFLRQKRVRHILALKGYDIRIGMPSETDLVGVWGKSPTAHRGEKVAARTNAKLLRVEDAFLRSVRPASGGDLPIGLNIDTRSVHFDSSAPSDLEVLLATHPLDNTALLDRARGGMARMKRSALSKYNNFVPEAPFPEDIPDAGYVLVIDQTAGDASITHSGANADTFREMVLDARLENPHATIVLKTHPETQTGHKGGHFGPADIGGNVVVLDQNTNPHRLLEGAIKVYAVSSQMGFEAIMAGHKPILYGQPFYAGWGLSEDRAPIDRRTRTLTRAQLFAGAMILYPTWYDPYRDVLCSFEDTLSTLEALSRTWREDHNGWAAPEMRLWKRKHTQAFFGSVRPVKFGGNIHTRRIMRWGAHDSPEATVEDGFLRSKGLGANLVPPLSLVLDDLGIYYDPTRESRLEKLIDQSLTLEPTALRRAEALRQKIIKSGVSKYNLGVKADLLSLPKGHRILVPGQVEDDASIKLGTSKWQTNSNLLIETRRANPDAILIYKPHPDVGAGLRKGGLSNEAAAVANIIATNADALDLLACVDSVWTMTSTLGFEALLRGVPVTCLGAPFYAGWGLTTDIAHTPDRRTARPSLDQFTHATLIDYPRYYDPEAGYPCPPEVAVDRLAMSKGNYSGLGLRLLAKAQGALSTYAHLWR